MKQLAVRDVRSWLSVCFLFIGLLIAVAVQMSYRFLMTSSIVVYGPESFIMSTIVVALGICLVWFSRRAGIKGWMS